MVSGVKWWGHLELGVAVVEVKDGALDLVPTKLVQAGARVSGRHCRFHCPDLLLHGFQLLLGFRVQLQEHLRRYAHPGQMS